MFGKLLLASAAAFFFVSLGHLGFCALEFPVLIKQKPDCTGTPPSCIVNAECNRRGGSCATGGTNGEDGYKDPNGDNCGCQL